MGSTLKPGSHHEVLRSVCPRLCGPCPPPTTPLPSPPSSTDSHTEPWPPLGMPSLTLLPTSYAHAPVVYNALDSGLVYPLAEPYVHDATGDVADDASPAAEAYVHDA